MAITIYPAEEEAGLGELLRRPLCAAWDAPVRLRQHGAKAAAGKPVADRRGRAVATNLGQEDLFYLDNILVTAGYELDADRGVPVGWNKNDQIFDPLEVWAARNTPEDKPFNYGHDCADIIGHTTACFAETLTGERIPDDATTLPGAFNIVSSDVLYRVWQDAALQERMDGILANLTGDEPSWFVSMECLYADFDYALLDKSKKLQIVARNAETAFLSKYLRTAKGSGTYDGKRVGMVLRNLIFSGKGLVENPANPKSVVRTVAEAEAEAEALPSTEPAEKTHEKSRVSAAGYIPAPQMEPLMDETQALKTDKARLEAENAQLRVKLAEAETAKLAEAKQAQAKAEAELAAANQARIDLEKAKAEAEKSHAAASEQVKAEFDKVVAEKTALAAELAEAKQAQAKAQAEQKKAERTGRVVASLGLEPADAEKVAEPLAGLDDAAFAAHLELLSKARAAAPNETKVVGNTTSFPGGSATTPPTAFNVGTPPTALPAPKPGTAFSGAAAADAAGVLERATPETTPALGAGTPDPKVEDLRMAFAKQLGYEEPDADEGDDNDDDAA